VAQQAVDDDMQGDEYEEREEKEEPAFNSASAPPALATSPTFIGSPPPLPPSSAAAAAAAREAAALMEEHKEFQPIAPSSSPSSLPELIDVYGVVSRASRSAAAVAAASMQGIRVALPEVQFEPAGLALMLDAPASSAAAARPFSRPDVPDSTAAALGRKVIARKIREAERKSSAKILVVLAQDMFKAAEQLKGQLDQVQLWIASERATEFNILPPSVMEAPSRLSTPRVSLRALQQPSCPAASLAPPTAPYSRRCSSPSSSSPRSSITSCTGASPQTSRPCRQSLTRAN